VGPSTRQPRPRGARLAVAFFAASGALELAVVFVDAVPPPFGALWQASGTALLHGLVAWGLWRGLALCRTLALVYALAALVTYGVVLGLALAGAPLRFPPSVVLMSLFQVPSCALLVPWLRSVGAARAFPRPLAGA
jgi:hypothetical protein